MALSPSRTLSIGRFTSDCGGLATFAIMVVPNPKMCSIWTPAFGAVSSVHDFPVGMRSRGYNAL